MGKNKTLNTFKMYFIYFNTNKNLYNRKTGHAGFRGEQLS